MHIRAEQSSAKETLSPPPPLPNNTPCLHRKKITMENGSQKWNFQAPNKAPSTAASVITVRGVLNILRANLNQEDERAVIPLGHGDPSIFSCFRTASAADDALIDAIKSATYNHYSPTSGLLPARRAVADYLSKDLPYKLSPDDVYLTLGCNQAVELSLAVLARPGGNILLPRPGFSYHELGAIRNGLEIRYFDLLPEEGWAVDIEAVEALADENTVAIVVINPGNPCGNVYSYEHLKKIAETARKLGILVIADEVYAYLAFGSAPFVPMGVFGSLVPVLTLGSISKRWIVPGWRIGWLVTNDTNGLLRDSGVVESINDYLNVSPDPATFIQAALPQILQNTEEAFFSRILNILRDAANLFYEKIQDIPCLICPTKPEGSMFVMVKMNLSLLEDIKDDMDFCLKLVKEESTFLMPGLAVGMKNWLRITFAIEPAALEVGLERIKAFCERHAKKQ